MPTLRSIWTLLAALVLTACQAMPPLNFSAPSVGVSERKIQAELRSVTVTLARPEEQTGRLPAGSEATVPLWQSSVVDALDRMAIFQDGAQTRVNLAVKILQIDIPAGGLSITTTVAARYEIIERNSGAVLFSKGIVTTGNSPAMDAFDANVRKRESLNRAVQNNIAEFLGALQALDVPGALSPREAMH